MHHDKFTDTNNNKPGIISFYNCTKSGVDALDMKCGVYSANRKTRRWALVIFYHMIALSCSNAYVVHRKYDETRNIRRFDFRSKLGLSLIAIIFVDVSKFQTYLKV